MKLGKLSESALKKSVLSPAGLEKDVFPSVDGQGIEIPEGYELVVTTDPITNARSYLPELGIYNGINDLAVCGAKPVGLTLTILLTEREREIYLSRFMKRVQEICQAESLRILGGHTEVTDAITRPLVSVTMFGIRKKGHPQVKLRKDEKRKGLDIIMAGALGVEGTAILATDRKEQMAKRFTPGFVRQCQDFIFNLSVRRAAEILGPNSYYLHDLSEGGIYAGLWELGEALHTGFEVVLKDFVIRQETIEVCELFDLNPYGLVSGGCLLGVTDHGEEVVEELREAGILAKIIGHLTDGSDRLMIMGEQKRFLDPPKSVNNCIYWNVAKKEEKKC